MSRIKVHASPSDPALPPGVRDEILDPVRRRKSSRRYKLARRIEAVFSSFGKLIDSGGW